MKRRIPEKGEIYRHYNGKTYKILGIATCTETRENMVAFKPVKGEDRVYVSSLENFLSPLDPEKCLNADQKYRFELCCRDEEDHSLSGHYDSVTSLILEFLDLDDNEDRIHFLQRYREQIDSHFLTVAAESLDFVDTYDTVEEKYDALLRFLKTRVKYEGRRLR